MCTKSLHSLLSLLGFVVNVRVNIDVADASFILENMPFNIFYRCLHMRIDDLVDIFRLGLNFILLELCYRMKMYTKLNLGTWLTVVDLIVH